MYGSTGTPRQGIFYVTHGRSGEPFKCGWEEKAESAQDGAGWSAFSETNEQLSGFGDIGQPSVRPDNGARQLELRQGTIRWV